jgi:hypothetical protein
MKIGTQWVNNNGQPTTHGFDIDMELADLFIVFESTNAGANWKAIAEFETIFDAVLFTVRKTEEAYAALLDSLVR